MELRGSSGLASPMGIPFMGRIGYRHPPAHRIRAAVRSYCHGVAPCRLKTFRTLLMRSEVSPKKRTNTKRSDRAPRYPLGEGLATLGNLNMTRDQP